jgi:hypothetical protein
MGDTSLCGEVTLQEKVGRRTGFREIGLSRSPLSKLFQDFVGRVLRPVAELHARPNSFGRPDEIRSWDRFLPDSKATARRVF